MWLSCIGALLLMSGGMCNLGGDHHQHHGDHHQHLGDPNLPSHGGDNNHHIHQIKDDNRQECTKRSLGCSSHEEDFTDDLGELFLLFGLKVLGKDQESADDRPPTEDHVHLQLNTKNIIDELFSPSSTHRPTSSSPPRRTITKSLPINAHNIARFSSPSDLVMFNHIAEPVFERKPRNFGSTTQAPVYLTETHYYLDHHNIEETQHFSPLHGFRQGKLFNGYIQFYDHLDKPVIPVTDMRLFNFVMINDVSVEEILKSKKRRPKLESDLIGSNPFTNDVFKNIPTQELIERNKHIQAGSFFVTSNQSEFQSFTDPPATGIIPDSTTLKQQSLHGLTAVKPITKLQFRNKERPSLNWKPPFKNPVARSNDHQKIVTKQTSQKSVPEQGKDTGITDKIQRQQSSHNVKNAKIRDGNRINTNKPNSKQSRKARIKLVSQNKSKHVKDRLKPQKLNRSLRLPIAVIARTPLQKIIIGKNLPKDNLQSKALTQAKKDVILKHAPKEQHQRHARVKNAFSGQNQQTKKLNNEALLEVPQGHRQNSRPPLQPRRGKQEMIIQATGDSTINILHSTLAQVRKDVQNLAKEKSRKTAPGGSGIHGETNRNSKHGAKQKKKNQTTRRLSVREKLNVGQNSKNNVATSQRRTKAFTRDAKINHSTKLSSTFQCSQRKVPGVYADISTSCQRFFMCQADGRKGIFTCPLGTLFNQRHQVCDWLKKVDCSNSHIYFDI